MKNDVLVVVQCRYDSTRLRGKALYPISGIPMLAFLLKRLRVGLSRSDDTCHIIVATTQSQQDDVIAAWGTAQELQVVRGEEHDVLKRYITCLERYPAETVVRVTADNPLTCPEILKWLVREQQERNVDYVQCKNLPYGVGVDVFSSGALRSLEQKATDPEEREHINLHILRNLEKFTTFFPYIEGELARPELLMTVDTYEDWKRVKALFTPEDTEPWRISLAEAIVRMGTFVIRQ